MRSSAAQINVSQTMVHGPLVVYWLGSRWSEKLSTKKVVCDIDEFVIVSFDDILRYVR